MHLKPYELLYTLGELFLVFYLSRLTSIVKQYIYILVKYLVQLIYFIFLPMLATRAILEIVYTVSINTLTA